MGEVGYLKGTNYCRHYCIPPTGLQELWGNWR